MSPATSTATSTTASSYPSSKTLVSSLTAASSASLLLYLIPELTPLDSSLPSSKQQLYRSRSTSPVSSSSLPQVSILTPSSLYKYASTYSSPTIFNTTTTLAEPVTSAALSSAVSPITTNTLFFPGTCHHSAYLVFLPDPTSDLVLDFAPLIKSTFKEYCGPLDDPEDDKLEDFLTIYLFEEDEIEMARRKREKTFSWTVTIPRPPDSIALPRPKAIPGQERERGKGWSRRRQGRWHGRGHYCLGGKAMDVDIEYGLRHWIGSLNNTKSTLLYETHRHDTATDECLRTETYETESRIAALVRSINKLDTLVT
ncbi:hypothetical protein BGX27_009420 [Mortierella sp. AM989]|nr:hypothetical protein BGX27_009420 [Mortierella sp. AM989]